MPVYPMSHHEFKAICAGLDDNTSHLQALIQRLDASLYLMHDMTPDEMASIRALQRETNALANRVYELFENSYRYAEMQQQEPKEHREQDGGPELTPTIPFKLPRAQYPHSFSDAPQTQLSDTHNEAATS